MKKDEVVISTDNEELRGVLLAWVKDSGSNPLDYLTKEGVAYLDGYLQGNDLTELIKKERYDIVVSDYEKLIDKYELLVRRNRYLSEDNKKLRNNFWNRFKDKYL